MNYPDDANGDALRRMEEQGDDLTSPRNVEFTVVFPEENAAKQFADHFSTLGYAASVELTKTIEDFPWDVVVVKHMVLSHEEIGAFETWAKDRQSRHGQETSDSTILDDAPGMELPASYEIRFARGTARKSPWCAVEHRVIDWAFRSSAKRSSK